METERCKKLIHIVEILETQEVVTWDEVYDHLTGYPNWVTIIERIQSPGLNKVARMYESPGFVTIDKHIVEQIHRFLKPYALIFSLEAFPCECARQLDEWLGSESVSFCKRCIEDRSSDISLAAQSVLPAAEALAKLNARGRKNWFQKLFQSKQ